MFERFTDRSRRVLVLAQEEARLLDHNFIGTEHILLGLIHDHDGIPAKVMGELGVSLEAARNRVQEAVVGQARGATGSPPFSPPAKKTLEHGLRQALDLGHNYIGPEHLLLGMLDDPSDPTVAILSELGGESGQVRARVLEWIRTPHESTGTPLVEPDGGITGPTCPGCGARLDQAAVWSRLAVPASGQPEDRRSVIVVHCQLCGRTTGVLPGGE